MKFIKIYGLQRTGTNYVEWLIRENFCNVHVFKEGNVLGWKHGEPPKQIDWTGKNWDCQPVKKEIIESYKKSILGLEKEINKNFYEDNIIYIICTRNPYSWLYKNVNLKDIKTWNEKNKIWLNFYFSKKNAFIINHYDVIKNYNFFLEKLSKKYGLIKNKKNKNINLKLEPRLKISKKIFDKNFYQKKDYMKIIKKNDKILIKKNINKKLIFDLGLYKKFL
jgi:hypothetical protein